MTETLRQELQARYRRLIITNATFITNEVDTMKIPWTTQAPFLRHAKLTLPSIAVSIAVLVSACTSSAPDRDVVLMPNGLAALDSCGELLDKIKEEALTHVGPYGFETHVLDGGFDALEITTDEAVTNDVQVDAPEADGGKTTSGTNIQEENVDESDFVKSDGKILAVVTDAELRILDVTGPTPELTETVSLSALGHPTGMYLTDGRLLLLSIDQDPLGVPVSFLTEINVKTGVVGDSTEFEGEIVSSRVNDGTLRLVLSSSGGSLGFTYPESQIDESAAERHNREAIKQSKIEDWVPSYQAAGDSTPRRQLTDCDQVHLPANFSGGGNVTVVTINPGHSLGVVDAVSVQADAQTVYASTDRLIVAATQWPSKAEQFVYNTSLHSFDTSSPNQTSYVASGSVPGLLLNQFSLSEHNGHLRVATTSESPLTGVSESFVSILAENGEALDTVGQVGGLGRGETIFAVRFIGDVGYVVTFRQTDPLYTIDLKDPSNPSVLGELKIPGFSNYLHEIDDRTLLGVGSDGTDSGEILGAAVSMFDIEDLSDPTRLDKLVFSQDTSTPVAHDAKAFTFWKASNTALVPLESFSDSALASTMPTQPYIEQAVSQVAVIDIDPEVGRVELRGTIDHQKPCIAPTTAKRDRRTPREGQRIPVDCNQSTVITRTMIIGDQIYSFSSSGVGVHNLDNLDEVAWVAFG